MDRTGPEVQTAHTGLWSELVAFPGFVERESELPKRVERCIVRYSLLRGAGKHARLDPLVSPFVAECQKSSYHLRAGVQTHGETGLAARRYAMRVGLPILTS